MDDRGLIEALTTVFGAERRIRAAYLAGSHGRGTADEFSDVDVVVCAAPADVAALCDDLVPLVAGVAEIVHAQRVGDKPVFTFIARPWLRFDVSVQASDEPGPQWTVLFGSPGAASESPTSPAIDPHAVAALTREFLRVLGLLPVVLGRREYGLGVAGFGLLHGMIIRAIRLGAEVDDPGGVLGLRHLADPDVYRRFESLPPVSASAAAVTDAHLACAELFLPLARALHHRSGAAWPQAMAEALVRHLCATVDERFESLAIW